MQSNNVNSVPELLCEMRDQFAPLVQSLRLVNQQANQRMDELRIRLTPVVEELQRVVELATPVAEYLNSLVPSEASLEPPISVQQLSKKIAELDNLLLGRKSGSLTQLMGRLRQLSPEERKIEGERLKYTKQIAEETIQHFKFSVTEVEEAEKLNKERIDVTLPGRRTAAGHLHPITLLRQRIEDIFVSMGYEIEDGPEIETSFYNFEALNIPANHPARSPQDTFYLAGEHGERLSLRSQTSTMQIHAMQRRAQKGPPLRIAAPGRVFRRDTPDATHNPMFYQVEGLLVDRGITLGDLKGTVEEFVRRLFGPDTKTRFRPSYFPFVEPGAEIDYTCFKCHGSGCRVCKQSGWIEMGGSGMVHPNVLRGVGIDPQEFSGFAFGLGLDRLCALMYGLDDIRLLYENDVRFLEQFS